MIGTLNPERFKDLLTRYDQALSHLDTWGISISASSRLITYKNTLTRLGNGEYAENPSEHCDLSFHVLEADEISDIVHSLDAKPDTLTLTKLADLPSDSPVRGENKHSPGRSSQFELYTRFLGQAAGFASRMGDPEAAEADVVLSLPERDIQIEAKRPLSKSSFESNIRKALSQLSSDDPGVIIVSIDHLLFGQNKIIQLESGETGQDAKQLVEDETKAFLDAERKNIDPRLRKKRSAAGLILLTKAPIYSGNLVEMHSAHAIRTIVLNGFSVDRIAEINQLADAINPIWGNENF